MMKKIFFYGRIASGRSKPITERLMVILSVLVALMVLGMGGMWYIQYQKSVERESIGELHLMMREFQSLIAQQAGGLSIAIHPIAEDEITRKGLIQEDRQLLQKRWNGVYERMRREKVTHFYFYNAKRVCLLRLHAPSRYGDKIDRFTAKQAEILGKKTWGLELGALGMFTLRVVEPVYEGERVIGYVELGKEIEDVLDELYFHFSHEMELLVDKQFVSRSEWEEGMKLLGRNAEWNISSDFAVSYATSESVCRFFGSRINKGHRHVDSGEIVEYHEKPYAVSYLPVHDASGKESAHLQVMRDMTAQSNHSFETLMWILGIGGAFWGMIMIVIKKILDQTDLAIEESLYLSSTKEIQ